MSISNDAIYVNGVAYSASQVQVILSNTPIAGVKSLSWEVKRDIKNNYGLGSEPTSFGYGQNTYSASIELDLDTYTALTASAPKGDITLLAPFIITYLFQPDPLNVKTKTTILKNVVFTNRGYDVNAGDTIIYKKFDLNYAGVTES